SEVVLISRKSRTAMSRWTFTDVGKFSGLIETLGESIKYPIYTERTGEPEEAVIAGPTCDSTAILYEDYKYGMPEDLQIGDRLYWLSTGAYTTSYSAIEFNGFPPLKQYVIECSLNHPVVFMPRGFLLVFTQLFMLVISNLG